MSAFKTGSKVAELLSQSSKPARCKAVFRRDGVDLNAGFVSGKALAAGIASIFNKIHRRLAPCRSLGPRHWCSSVTAFTIEQSSSQFSQPGIRNAC